MTVTMCLNTNALNEKKIQQFILHVNISSLTLLGLFIIPIFPVKDFSYGYSFDGFLLDKKIVF